MLRNVAMRRGEIKPGPHVVDGVLQEQDAVPDGVADVVFRVRRGRGNLLIRASFCQLLVLLTEAWTDVIKVTKRKPG